MNNKYNMEIGDIVMIEKTSELVVVLECDSDNIKIKTTEGKKADYYKNEIIINK